MIKLPHGSGDGSWHTVSPTQVLSLAWAGSGFHHGLRRGDGSSAGYTRGNGGRAYSELYTLGKAPINAHGNGVRLYPQYAIIGTST